MLKGFSLPFLPTLVVFVAVVIMLRLGFWQLERGDQKQQRLEQIEHKRKMSPYQVNDVLAFSGDHRDLPLSVTGRPQKDRILLLDNRIVQGQVGYEVLVPVYTDYGLVLVNLGWVKAGRTREELPVFDVSQLREHFTGRISVPALNPMITETANKHHPWPKIVQQIDLKYFQPWFEQPLLPFVLLNEGKLEGFQHNWKPVVMPPEKHLAYAIQWFGLALACFLVYLYALKRKRKNHEREEK